MALPMEPRGAARGMGCGARAAHGFRRCQGAVLQPPHPRQADRAAPKMRSSWSRTTSAAASARAASSIRRISSSRSRPAMLGRPVKWTEDRREHLMAINHARETRMRHRDRLRPGRHHPRPARACLCRHGRLYAHQRRDRARATSRSSCPAPIASPNIDIDVSLLLTNKTPVGTYRGPGRFEADFFRERLFDMVAKDLGIDRVEFRRRNLVAAAEMPYRIATHHALRKQGRTRQRRLSRHARPLPRRDRLGGKARNCRAG